MARVRGKDTKPELRVRRAAFALGFRFRLHRRDLPGTPDLVFPRLRKAILVHGCFWHRHPGCRGASTPVTRTEYWSRKFEENQLRDRRKLSQLADLGWDTLVIWECQTKDPGVLRATLTKFLSN